MGRPKGSKNKVRYGTDKTCKHCGEVFYVANNRTDKANFCSRRCNASYHLIHMEHTRECRFCGVTFSTKREGGKPQWYCSRKCQKEADRIRFKTPETALCKQCGKEFPRAKYQAYKTLFCSRDCRLMARPFPKNRRGVRRAAIRRGLPMDKCSICSYSEHPEILTVHHKDLNPQNNKPDNLIVVCPNCHSLAHGRLVFSPTSFSAKETKVFGTPVTKFFT